MVIGEFLVEKELITQDVLDKAVEIQTQKRIPIGTVACENKFIDEKQLVQILKVLRENNEKGESKGKRFGDVSIELGFLTSEDVFKIKRIQDSTTPMIGNVLREMNAISSIVFVKALREFKAQSPEWIFYYG